MAKKWGIITFTRAFEIPYKLMRIATISLIIGAIMVSWLWTYGMGTAWAEQGSDPYLIERQRMVERDLKSRDITDPKVLEVMARLERHLFVPKSYQDQAYADHPLPIGEGQTISQPYIVAYMTQALSLKPGEKVLEIGTGSGYQAAVLSYFTDHVYTIEIRKGLAEEATDRLERLGYDKIKVKHADGYFGWEEYAPFDAVIITAAANHIPPPLMRQLKEGGRLLLPLGSTWYEQNLTRITKTKEGRQVEHLLGVIFVPMVGKALE